jgi:5-methylcytosine-specific restriction endonuclease McrA
MKRRTSILWTISKEDYIKLFDNSDSLVNVLKKIGVKCYGRNAHTLKYVAVEKGINLKHYQDKYKEIQKVKSGLRLKRGITQTIPTVEFLVENRVCSSSSLKKRLFSEGLLKDACSNCGIGNEWDNKYISLHLDHINGVHDDNRIENLRILCPNCHSQTETYAGKALKNKNAKVKICKSCNKEPKVRACGSCDNTKGLNSLGLCADCALNRKVEFGLLNRKFNPTKEELTKLIWEDKMPYRHIGALYGVSDNAVKKRCKVLEIPLRRIKQTTL